MLGVAHGAVLATSLLIQAQLLSAAENVPDLPILYLNGTPGRMACLDECKKHTSHIFRHNPAGFILRSTVTTRVYFKA
jgi:hypothetical protein